MASSESFVDLSRAFDSETGLPRGFASDAPAEDLKAFFDEFGFVVVENVLSPEELSATVDELWSHEDLLGRPGILRADPSSWQQGWPAGEKGFLGSRTGADEIWAWENRQNPRVIRPFEVLLDTPELVLNLDRYGVLRPTRGIVLLDGSVIDKPEWESPASWLHWDQNPFRTPEFHGVQGLVTLSDQSDVKSGGFMCVPGFQKAFGDWAKGKIGNETTVPLPVPLEETRIHQQTVKIPLAAGSLLIWDSRLPHQNFPNHSAGFRIVQYITYFPAQQDPLFTAEFRRVMKNRVKTFASGFYKRLTLRGKQVCGLLEYGQAEEDEELVADNPHRAEALALYRKGEEFEMAGDHPSAVSCFSKAFRLDPNLEIL